MRSRITRISSVLALVALLFSGLLMPAAVPTASAAPSETITLTPSGPSYVTPGSNITYELTLKNFTSQPITAITVWNPLPVHTTHVSGGSLFPADNGVAFNLASLAANDTHKFTLVVKVGSGVAIGTVIENKNVEIESFTVGGDTFSRSAETAVGTTVEAPGTLAAVYKNSNGRAFDVAVDGFHFDNYTNDPPRVSSDDLSAADIFTLLGPRVCKSGTTAATCVLSGPAQKYLDTQIKDMSGGHCDGMATISLRLFDQLPFKGKSSPSDFQSGATNTFDLNFPAQSIENYVAYYFITQVYDEVYYDGQYMAGPKEIVNRLTTDFNKTPPVGYVLWIDQLPNHSKGHAVTAYGVETVNANESRILIYDNNYPNQRKYLTVNMAANTWRYVTASTPGETPDIYTGGATTKNLSIVRNNARELAAGQYFTCDFCNEETSSTGVQASTTDAVTGTISFQYAGEGAFLVVNDADQSTGFAFDTETFINEIPDAQLIYARGGLGKEVPPRIEVPFAQPADKFYSVYISGKTINSVADGSLIMTGEGYAMGLEGIQLDPDELLELAVSPNGNYIDFKASQTITAPAIYLAYDPVNAEDPSVIFEVSNVILDAGESVLLNMDRDKEQVFFDDTGAQGQAFDVVMTLIWPDGDVQEFVRAVDVPAGATSAFIDFGAWDGLMDPPLYISDILQNPSINHRLKLTGSQGSYDPTPKTDAPLGVYRVEATFANVTQIILDDISFTVANLAGGNLLLNANGGSGGLGATVSVLPAQLGEDGKLSPNESFTVTFEIGLKSKDVSDLTVDSEGVPIDWAFTTPAPTYDANNASFHFRISGSNAIFVPILTN